MCVSVYNCACLSTAILNVSVQKARALLVDKVEYYEQTPLLSVCLPVIVPNTKQVFY